MTMAANNDELMNSIENIILEDSYVSGIHTKTRDAIQLLVTSYGDQRGVESLLELKKKALTDGEFTFVDTSEIDDMIATLTTKKEKE
jgi:hypothetical protein